MSAETSADDDALPDDCKFLGGGGEATRLILARDWTGHPLGVPRDWPAGLKTALSLVLNSPESMILCWGRDELTFFFNETYFPLLGPRLGWAMGAPFREVWSDAWAQAQPIINDAFAGRSQHFDDLPWKLDTDRGSAETWFSSSYSRILDAKGDIAGLFIFTNETTHRVLANRELEATQEKLRALNETLSARVEARTLERDRMWNTSPDLMIVADREGVYRQVNQAWMDHLGYAAEEVIGKTANDFIHPADLARIDPALDAARSDEGLAPVELRFRHKDGSYRWLQWVAAPGDGEIFAIGRNISAEKQAEAQLIAAEEQLRQAQKMEAVGQLTGGIAHDFNNMLTGVISSLDMLQRRLGPDANSYVERYIEGARTSAQRAAGLTHRLLAFSRRQSLDVRATDVAALTTSLADLLRRTLGENIALEFNFAANTWHVLTDANQLESALLNLTINARDAMPDGGTVTISSANSHVEKPDDPRGMAPGEYVCLSVRDTGVGMTADTLEHAFEPFFTTKPIGTGTGLGLSMIYGFAQQASGSVTIDSAPGLGTEVVLHLPRATNDAPAEEVAPNTVQRAAPGRTILVVEDEIIVRMLMVEVLEDLGYRVVEAGSGDEALQLLEAMDRIDLLVTDVGLPGMNGRELAAKVRERHPGLGVLFATGYAEQAGDRGSFLDAGMEMIAKPFVIDELSATIAHMIERGRDAPPVLGSGDETA